MLPRYGPAVAEASLRERRQALLARAGLQGRTFCRAYAAEADRWLAGLAERATEGAPRHLALLAVGGYGRGELCPYSDLDVVLVHDGRRDVARVADAIWYPVWDQGVQLDHSVRRPKEVLAAAAGDLRVALGLLDGRMVWGDRRVADPLLERARREWAEGLGARWVEDLARQMEERRRTAGDLAYLLEPDLKESHGGLRDINVLRSVAAALPRLADEVDLDPLEPAEGTLTAVRVELHRGAGRAQERLLLQDQDQVAAALDYPDADVLMAAVARAGREVAWVAEDMWRRRRLWPSPPAGRRRRGRRDEPAGPPSVVEIEPGVALVGEEVALSSGARVEEDGALPLRLAAVGAERDRPLARGALRRLADRTPPPPDPWPIEVRQDLVRLLRAGRPAIGAIEALDHHGLFTRYLPEWDAVRNKPQRNAYHRFTVDRHLLEAAANAAELTDRVGRPDLLVVGTLLHDIGKGYPGDHTEVGEALVAEITTRMGFPAGDVATMVALERNHLLLADTATRRDLDDPATVERVAGLLGDPDTVALLAALTEADSLATGPAAWGPWKAGLVADLADRTIVALTGGVPAPRSSPVADGQRAAVDEVHASGRPAVVLDPPQVVVAAPDRRGLLAQVAGTLALHGLDVRSADASSEGGVAVDTFTVEVARGTWPDTARLREDLEAVLSDRLALVDRLAAKAAAYAGGRRPTSARPVVRSVAVDNEASRSSTVVEVRAPDEVGLLHRVTRALFDCDLDVVSARVSTAGAEVVDAFYVRDAAGAKVTGEAHQDRLRQAVLGSLT